MIGLALKCRTCGGKNVESFLNLGKMPLANALLTQAELDSPEPRYSLQLAFCSDCALAQIVDTVPPEKLFREYLYFSSYSTTMLEHAGEIAATQIQERKLNASSLVVEIASNDGYLLQYFKQAGIPVLGIEPAFNVAKVAEKEKGIPTLTEFFGKAVAQRLKDEGKQADLILANNVMAHVEDLNGFVESIQILLKDTGLAVIEVPYVREMIDRCEFDTIYHEHIYYFSVTALEKLFKKHGLRLTQAERIPIHGGSLRLRVEHAKKNSDSKTLEPFLKEEQALGLNTIDYYRTFSKRVEALKIELCARLEELKKSGKRLAAYGAAAKGTVLLNYCNLGDRVLDFVVDRSIHKQGRYVPGVRLPIHPTGRLLEEKPDYVLLLTWNIADEILQQQSEYRRQGGKFVIPIPQTRIV